MDCEYTILTQANSDPKTKRKKVIKDCKSRLAAIRETVEEIKLCIRIRNKQMESTNELITKKIQHKIRNTLEEMVKKIHISTLAWRVTENSK
jgi:hypothetical protein